MNVIDQTVKSLRHFAGVLHRPDEREKAQLLRDAADAIEGGQSDPALAIELQVWSVLTAQVHQPEIASMLERASSFTAPGARMAGVSRIAAALTPPPPKADRRW